MIDESEEQSASGLILNFQMRYRVLKKHLQTDHRMEEWKLDQSVAESLLRGAGPLVAEAQITFVASEVNISY